MAAKRTPSKKGTAVTPVTPLPPEWAAERSDMLHMARELSRLRKDLRAARDAAGTAVEQKARYEALLSARGEELLERDRMVFALQGDLTSSSKDRQSQQRALEIVQAERDLLEARAEDAEAALALLLTTDGPPADTGRHVTFADQHSGPSVPHPDTDPRLVADAGPPAAAADGSQSRGTASPARPAESTNSRAGEAASPDRAMRLSDLEGASVRRPETPSKDEKPTAVETVVQRPGDGSAQREAASLRVEVARLHSSLRTERLKRQQVEEENTAMADLVSAVGQESASGKNAIATSQAACSKLQADVLRKTTALRAMREQITQLEEERNKSRDNTKQMQERSHSVRAHNEKRVAALQADVSRLTSELTASQVTATKSTQEAKKAGEALKREAAVHASALRRAVEEAETLKERLASTIFREGSISSGESVTSDELRKRLVLLETEREKILNRLGSSVELRPEFAASAAVFSPLRQTTAGPLTADDSGSGRSGAGSRPGSRNADGSSDSGSGSGRGRSSSRTRGRRAFYAGATPAAPTDVFTAAPSGSAAPSNTAARAASPLVRAVPPPLERGFSSPLPAGRARPELSGVNVSAAGERVSKSEVGERGLASADHADEDGAEGGQQPVVAEDGAGGEDGWRARCEELQRENASLQEQVARLSAPETAHGANADRRDTPGGEQVPPGDASGAPGSEAPAHVGTPKSTNATSTAEATRLRSERDLVRGELRVVLRERDEALEVVDRLRSELVEVGEKVARYRAEKTVFTEKIEQVEKKYKDRFVFIQEKTKTHLQYIADLESRLESAERRDLDLQSQLAMAAAERERWHHQCNEAESKLKQTTEKAAQSPARGGADGSEERVRALEAQLAESALREQQLTEELDAAQGQRRVAEARSDTLDRKFAAKFRTLREEAAANARYITDLEEKQEQLEDAREKLLIERLARHEADDALSDVSEHNAAAAQ